jgi:hypothetical protein
VSPPPAGEPCRWTHREIRRLCGPLSRSVDVQREGPPLNPRRPQAPPPFFDVPCLARLVYLGAYVGAEGGLRAAVLSFYCPACRRAIEYRRWRVAEWPWSESSLPRAALRRWEPEGGAS